jgi:hypothetical protein
MMAGQMIDYLPGTKVNSGGSMHGYISNSGACCGIPAPAPALSQNHPSLKTAESISGHPAVDSRVKVYPNPTPGKFYMELNGELLHGTVNMVVYDIRGEKALAIALSGKRKYEFSLAEKPSGIYVVRMICGDNVETLKLVKADK